MRLILENKKILYSVIVFLFVVIVFLVFLILKTLDQSSIKIPEVVSTPTKTTPPTPIQKITPSLKTKEEIKKEIKINIVDAIQDENLTIYGPRIFGEWSVVAVEPKDKRTDPANILLKKEGGLWKIMLGPGTSFDEESLLQIGAPSDLLQELNSPVLEF